jgi:hypothetical protein
MNILDKPYGMTVGELIDNLTGYVEDSRRAGVNVRSLPVEIWLPGSRITIDGQPFKKGDAVLIEGNIKPGSVLAP